MRIGGLELGGRLDRYVGALFVGAYATSLFLIVGLAVIIDVATNLSYFETWEDGTSAPLSTILRFYLLNVPFLYLQVAPFVTTAAALFTLSKLLRYNELVAGLNAGVSAQRVLLPIHLGALAVALGMFALREGATSALGEQRAALRDYLDKHRTERVIEDVTLRDLAGNIVVIESFAPTTATIRGLQVAGLRGDSLFFVVADRATYDRAPDGAARWRLVGGHLRTTTGDTAVARAVDWLDVVDFSPRDVSLAKKGDIAPMELSFSELGHLAARDPTNLEYQTLFQYHLTFPLGNLVLVLLTTPFLLGRERGKATEGMVAAALACVVYFAADFVCRSLGMEGTLSPLWSSWLPILCFGSLGVALSEGART